MHSLLLSSILLLASPALAFNCNGDTFNGFCCVNGHFTGPVISSFSSAESSRKSSQSAFQFSLQASLSSQFATFRARTVGADASVITEPAKLRKRTVTVQVSPGLTCVGDAAITESVDAQGSMTAVTLTGTGGGSGTGSETTTKTSSGGNISSTSTGTAAGGSGSAGADNTSSTSSSKAGAAVVTQAPMLAIGVAAAFAYEAM